MSSTPASHVSSAPPDIVHSPHARRFETVVEGELARLDYRLSGSTLHILHTVVPPALEGRGIASALTGTAVDHARGHGLTIVPDCAYARAWLARHPEHADLVAR